MSCKRCSSDRIVSVCGKTSDLCLFEYANKQRDGYVPYGVGLGDNEDYIEFEYCAECGQMQGKFPISEAKLKAAVKEIEL